MKRIVCAIALSFTMGLTIWGQTVDSRNPTTGKGIVFKIPENVFPVDWNKSGFIGILMLEKDSPSGVFAVYPNNEGETIEALRERVAKFIVPMFAPGETEKKEFVFKKMPIPNHKGDFGTTGSYYLYESEKTLVQVLFYERQGDTKNMLYGYFAKRDKDSKKKDSAQWADEKGQGVKILDKFAKSFK
jgi:hypothetical protein